MTVKAIDATILRANLGDAIDEVKKGNILEVRRRGKSEVALIDLATLEDWLAAQDPAYVRAVKTARAQAKAGKTTAFEDVFSEVVGIN